MKSKVTCWFFVLLLVPIIVNSKNVGSTDCSQGDDISLCLSEPSPATDSPDALTGEESELNLPRPIILIVGATGTGKSSMAASLLGKDPSNKEENTLFPVCDSFNSCTKETAYGSGKWLGTGEEFTVVDTPGFSDSDGQDEELIREMLYVLKNKVKSVDGIVLLIKGSTTRFTKSLQAMLVQMSSIFGKGWWERLFIGVSFWQYDQLSIQVRENTCHPVCKDETWFQTHWQKQMETKFDQSRTFQIGFMHSYSQAGKRNREDAQQQEYWKKETQKLWEFVTKQGPPFELKGVDDILSDFSRCKRQVVDLTENLETRIQTLEENKAKADLKMTKLDEDVAGLQHDVNTDLKGMKSDVLTNSKAIHMKADEDAVKELKEDLFKKADASTVQSKISKAVNSLESEVKADIKDMTNKVSENEKAITINNFAREASTRDLNTNKAALSDIKEELFKKASTATVNTDIKTLNAEIKTKAVATTIQSKIDYLESELKTKAVATTIQSKIDDLESDLKTKAVATTIQSKIDDLESDLKTKAVASEVLTLKTAMRNLLDVPLGTIIAWVTKPQKGSAHTEGIPAGWLACDGSTIPSLSKWAGHLTPDLNSNGGRFLRGGKHKDMLTMQEDQMQDHKHIFTDPSHKHGIRDPGHSHQYSDYHPKVNDQEVNDDDDDIEVNDGEKVRNPHTHSAKTGITVDTAKTGATVSGVTSTYRRGEESRPKNMAVIYIMRIY